MIAKALKEKPGQNPWVWASADKGSSFMIQQFGLHGGLSTSRIFMFSALKLETKVLGIHKISAYHKQKSSHKGRTALGGNTCEWGASSLALLLTRALLDALSLEPKHAKRALSLHAVSAFVPGCSMRHEESQGHVSQNCALFINPACFCFMCASQV